MVDNNLYFQFYDCLKVYNNLKDSTPNFICHPDLNYPGKEEFQDAKNRIENESGTWEVYFQALIRSIATYYYDAQISDKHRFLMLHALFNEFDLYLMKGVMTDSHSQANNFTLIYENKFYINTSFFWKVSSVPDREMFVPSESGTFQHGFKTFGLCLEKVNYRFVDLTDMIEQQLGINPIKILEKIKISLFSLSTKYPLNFKLTGLHDPTRNTYGFICDNVCNKQAKEDIDEVFRNIQASGTHIACLPEMTISDEMLVYINEKLAILKPKFLIFIAGSYHRSTDDSYCNVVPILIHYHGKSKTLWYSKTEPFVTQVSKIMGHVSLINEEEFISLTANDSKKIPYADFVRFGNIKEAITPVMDILICNIREIGNIGFLICKDYIEEKGKILNACKSLADHLFVISLNSSEEGRFYQRAGILAGDERIATYYVNARSYDRAGLSPTFYYLPLKAKGDDGKLECISEKIGTTAEMLPCDIDIPEFRKKYFY